VALSIVTGLIVSLHYKLRMFGVPLTGAANVFVTIKELSITPLHWSQFWARGTTRFVTTESGRLQWQVLFRLRRRTQIQIWQTSLPSLWFAQEKIPVAEDPVLKAPGDTCSTLL